MINSDVLFVQPRAANEYLTGSTSDSLFGIPLAAEDSEIAHIDGAFKLLTSADEGVMELAWKDVTSTVAYRLSTGRRSENNPPPQITLDSLSAFLSGKTMPCMNPNSSIFTLARQASDRLGVGWCFDKDRSISLTTRRGTIINSRSKVFKSLRECFRSARSYKLSCKPDQGKTLSCFKKSKVSGHYNRTGDFIRFTDCRFIHKARLNLLPLNAVNPSNALKNMGCKHCKDPFEGLPHVLCHCNDYLQKITSRHDLVVDRLAKASSGSWTILKKNQPLAKSPKRPDLVLVKGFDVAMVLDVAVTFENGPSAFNEAREIKLKKYQSIAKELKKSYKEVSVEAVVVGALGSWDPKNDRVCHRICTRKYTKLMKKLIVSDVLRLPGIYITSTLPLLRSALSSPSLPGIVPISILLLIPFLLLLLSPTSRPLSCSVATWGCFSSASACSNQFGSSFSSSFSTPYLCYIPG